MAEPYVHRHFGTVIVWALAPALVVMLALALLAEMPGSARIVVWSVFAVLALALFLFWSLTVRVDAEAVSVWFGPGWPRTRVPLEDVESAEMVTKSWLWGYGLRWTPRGWLWRVAGRRAVELKRRGQKSVFVGTDDPAGLVRALRREEA